jgi:IS1 family transposase
VQVIKKRNDKGKIIEIGEKIVYGKKEDIEAHYIQAKRSKHINTDYVESRNGKFRLCCARLIRKTLCFS